MRVSLIAYLLGVLLSLGCYVSTPEENETSAIQHMHFDRFSDELISAMAAGSYADVAAAFQYPQPENRETEQRNLTEMIGIVFGQFGGLSEPMLLQKHEGETVYVTLVAGTAENLKTTPQGFAYAYQVEFAHQGKGSVIFDLIDADGEPRIRQLFFGLPKTNPDAVAVVKRVLGQFEQATLSETLWLGNEAVP